MASQNEQDMPQRLHAATPPGHVYPGNVPQHPPVDHVIQVAVPHAGQPLWAPNYVAAMPLVPDTPYWGLSLLSVAFMFCLSAAWLCVLVLAPLLGLVCILLLVPTMVLIGVWRYYRLGERLEKDFAVRIYGFGFLPGALCVLLVEIAVTAVLATICFADQLSEWREEWEKQRGSDDFITLNVRRTFGFYLFIFLTAFVVAAGTEETFKYLMAIRIRKRRPDYSDWRGIVFYAVAGALGFSTVENVGYTFAAYVGSDSEGGGGNIQEALATAIGRILLSTPVHVGTAALVGFGVAKRWSCGLRVPLWRLMSLPVFLHGAFDYVLLMAATQKDSLTDTEDALITIITAVATLLALCFANRYHYKKLREHLSQLPQQQPQQQQPDHQPPQLAAVPAGANLPALPAGYQWVMVPASQAMHMLQQQGLQPQHFQQGQPAGLFPAPVAFPVQPATAAPQRQQQQQPVVARMSQGAPAPAGHGNNEEEEEFPEHGDLERKQLLADSARHSDGLAGSSV